MRAFGWIESCWTCLFFFHCTNTVALWTSFAFWIHPCTFDLSFALWHFAVSQSIRGIPVANREHCLTQHTRHPEIKRLLHRIRTSFLATSLSKWGFPRSCSAATNVAKTAAVPQHFPRGCSAAGGGGGVEEGRSARRRAAAVSLICVRVDQEWVATMRK